MPAQRVSKASKRARKARQSVNGYIKHGFCDCDMCYGTVAVTYPKSLIKDHRQIYGHSRAMSYYAEPSAPPEHTLASPPIPVPDQMPPKISGHEGLVLFRKIELVNTVSDMLNATKDECTDTLSLAAANSLQRTV
ncbi:hypothetical protein FRC09_009044 [Ceratobasidium sp. 395]|nr:hypothetical protein FRC09_009044 [Ceratobasidium sp. 395]